MSIPIIEKRDRNQKTINKVDFEHRKTVVQMLKIIHLAPMDDDIKMLMRMRIWGKDPMVFNPMTYQQIVIDIMKRSPTSEDIRQLEDMESSGKFYVEQFLTSLSAQEIIDKFNKDFNGDPRQLF